MAFRAIIASSTLALAALSGLVTPAVCQDADSFAAAVAGLAESSKAYDAAFLAGLGQFYCVIKAGVGDEPFGPKDFVAAMHRKHRDMRPTSSRAGKTQLQAVVLADMMLCPE